VELFVTPLPVFDLGSNFTLCPGAAATLDATTAGATYAWSSGASTPTINAGTGNYSVQVTVNGCSSSDAITIGAFPAAQVDLGADVTLCPGDDLLLDVTQPGASYIWQDGSTASNYLIQNAGSVGVQLTDANGCVANDAMNAAYASPTAINLGPDQAICAGQQITLNATVAGATYLWSTGAVTPAISANATGNYSVVVTQGSCTVSDVMHLDVLALPVVNLGADQSICTGDVITLDATTPNVTYAWSTGAQTPTINVSQGGTYSVAITDANNCSNSDAVDVIEVTPAAIDLGPDIILCQGQTTTLDVTLPGASYSWSTGANTATIVVGATGNYSVDVTQGLCVVSDAIHVQVNPMPSVNLGNDQTLCAGNNTTLDATYPGASYTWSTGATTPSINVSTAGNYSVTVDLNGCTASDAITIGVLSLNAIDLGPDVILCAGQTTTFDAATPGVTYTWSTGANTAQITTGATGTYWVEATQAGCS
ncbi:MAG TPA: hypothetical protein PK760_12410, partial [Flavobacteriales bacterium]|nr:hypothetical protein [Flavobacteriales bacterium]